MDWTAGRDWNSKSPYCQHTLQRGQRAAHDVGRQLNPGRKVGKSVAQFFKRIKSHKRTFAAIAVLVGDVMEAAARRGSLQRIINTALGHHNKLARGAAGAILDDGGSRSHKIRMP